jgi:hypothetical protein
VTSFLVLDLRSEVKSTVLMYMRSDIPPLFSSITLALDSVQAAPGVSCPCRLVSTSTSHYNISSPHSSGTCCLFAPNVTSGFEALKEIL